jgi:AmmeMemoRadiSam system protein B
MNKPDKNNASIRQAAVAGYFYPAEATELRHMINQLMSQATATGPVPKALIAPHAGYIYSGITAARAYANLQPVRDKITRVILLGPAHRVYIRGMALSSATHFSTPLGNIEIDQASVKLLKKLPQVTVSDAAHQQEHSLEVHLPFLQSLLNQFTLVPLVVGETNPQEVAEVLELFWDDPGTLIIISSDLSHFHDYETAKKIDAATTHAIEHFELEKIGPEQACGCRPLCGMLELARTKKLSINTLDVRNSGDTAGTKDRVVGYGAWSLT